MDSILLTVPDVMELLGVSRKRAIRILNMKGCPVLPRKKGQTYLISKKALIDWIEIVDYRK